MNLYRHLALLFILLNCVACTATFAPVPTSTATVNLTDKSISETKSNVSVTVKLDQLSFAPYQLVDNISSFHVAIDNGSAQNILIASDRFVIRDNENRQYRTITAEKVRDIVSKDTVYLIPHPYVGYYYLEDRERYAYDSRTSSPLPFYAEYHPQDIFTYALPDGDVLPGAKVSGLIYFVADLTKTDRFELLVYPDGTMQSSPVYRFPFAIEK